MKLIAILLLTSTITVQTEAADLSTRIIKFNPSLDNTTVETLARELAKYPPVVTEIVKRESTFNPRAQSRGCIGLMGIDAKLWTDILIEDGIIKDPKDLWSIKLNIKAGWHIFNKKYKRSHKKYRGRR